MLEDRLLRELVEKQSASLPSKSVASSSREGDERSGCPRTEPSSREEARALEGRRMPTVRGSNSNLFRRIQRQSSSRQQDHGPRRSAHSYLQRVLIWARQQSPRKWDAAFPVVSLYPDHLPAGLKNAARSAETLGSRDGKETSRRKQQLQNWSAPAWSVLCPRSHR